MTKPAALVPDEFDRAVVGAPQEMPMGHPGHMPATHRHQGSPAPDDTAAARTGPSANPTTRPAAAPPAFVCPMHPEVVDTTASECPKCGMNLVPKEEDR